MSKRFIIDCYGIIDTWKSNTGICEKDRLSWEELCNTLNELDKIADDKLDNYEYATRLEKENQELRNALVMLHPLLVGMSNDLIGITQEIDKMVKK